MSEKTCAEIMRPSLEDCQVGSHVSACTQKMELLSTVSNAYFFAVQHEIPLPPTTQEIQMSQQILSQRDPEIAMVLEEK